MSGQRLLTEANEAVCDGTVEPQHATQCRERSKIASSLTDAIRRDLPELHPKRKLLVAKMPARDCGLVAMMGI
jgi:hypothetical protein